MCEYFINGEVKQSNSSKKQDKGVNRTNCGWEGHGQIDKKDGNPLNYQKNDVYYNKLCWAVRSHLNVL